MHGARSCSARWAARLGSRGPGGADGETGPQGAIGATGTQGPARDPIELGADTAFAVEQATLLGGADPPFSNNAYLGAGITHSAGSRSFTVGEAGAYRIAHVVSITAGVGASLTIQRIA